MVSKKNGPADIKVDKGKKEQTTVDNIGQESYCILFLMVPVARTRSKSLGPVQSFWLLLKPEDTEELMTKQNVDSVLG